MLINQNLLEYLKDIKIKPEFVKAMLFELIKENEELRKELNTIANV